MKVALSLILVTLNLINQLFGTDSFWPLELYASNTIKNSSGQMRRLNTFPVNEKITRLKLLTVVFLHH